jgi:hypothetical protein
MKTLIKLMTLLALASVGQAANIPITYLPFTITAPGTYVLATDLTSKKPNSFAISMYKPVGSVVLDLNGHTLHAAPAPFVEANTASYGVLVHLDGGAAGGITIRNGTLEGFAYGFETSTVTANKGSDLLIQNVTFKNDYPSSKNSESIHLVAANSAIITGCSFVGRGRVGILDEKNETGLTLSNLSFDGQLGVNIQQNGYLTYPQIVSFNSEMILP